MSRAHCRARVLFLMKDRKKERKKEIGIPTINFQ